MLNSQYPPGSQEAPTLHLEGSPTASSEHRGAVLIPGVTNVCFLLLTHQQTQSLYIHKELMKRTLGTPTCAIEAREYVVSLSMV